MNKIQAMKIFGEIISKTSGSFDDSKLGDVLRVAFVEKVNVDLKSISEKITF